MPFYYLKNTQYGSAGNEIYLEKAVVIKESWLPKFLSAKANEEFPFQFSSFGEGYCKLSRSDLKADTHFRKGEPKEIIAPIGSLESVLIQVAKRDGKASSSGNKYVKAPLMNLHTFN